jgi:hypothetical protein
MSAIKIQYEDTFKSMLNNPLNLFLGSGFSVLSNNLAGKPLLPGNSLRDELATRYEKSKQLSLSQICQIVERTPKSKDLNDYLTSNFQVDELLGSALKYQAVKKMNVKNVFTTNIDNLPYLIFNSGDTYLRDIRLLGPNMSDQHGVEYYPLHGSVITPEKGYNFNPISIGINGSSGYFKDLSVEIRKRPFLFWGYSLSDNNVITALYENANWLQTHQDKWMLVRNEDENEYFQSLGFKTINGSTEDLLDYISDYYRVKESTGAKNDELDYKDRSELKNYCIPYINNVPSFPLTNFYNGQHPQWSHIFSNEIFKTSHYAEIENNIHKDKSTLIIGIPVSGKSTLLMLLAANFSTTKLKLFFDEISLVQAEFVVKILGDIKCMIFIDRVCNDVEAIEFLFKHSNIQIIGAEREYNYQIVSHRLKKIFGLRVTNISVISHEDCKGIFDSIPNSLKKYTDLKVGNENDSLSIFEFVSMNIRTSEVKTRLSAAFRELNTKDSELLELFIMVCYVNSCRTAVSYSMIYSFLNYRKEMSWEDVYVRINQLGQMLKDANYAFDWFGKDQDYYLPRSEHFSNAVIEFVQIGDESFKRMLESFHESVSVLNIPNYKNFKRYAFDAAIISKAYSTYDEGKAFYELMFDRDPSEFLYQQAALFAKYKRKYKDAFFYIDKAINMAPYSIFSIKNTHAQIIFAANINLEDSSIVRDTLDKSMDILKECYEKDDRRLVHSLIFSDQSIKYFEKYGDERSKEFIKLAKQWVSEEINSNPWNRDLKSRAKDLNKVALL